MAGETPLSYVIRVKDDGSAVIERFNQNINNGLNRVPPAANQAGQSIQNVGNQARQAGQNIQNMGNQAQGAAQKMSGFQKMALGAFSIGAITAFSKASVENFNRYEDSVARLRALSLSTTGAVGKGFEGLKAQAVDMSKVMRYSATEVTQAMSAMKTFGLNESQIERGVKGVIDLATNELLSVKDAARVALSVQATLGKGSEDLTHALDTLAVTSVRTATNLTELGEAYKYIGVSPKLAGVSLEEVAATLGALANNGIRASMAGTTMRAMFNRILRPTADVARALRELNLLTEDGTKKYENYLDVIRAISQVEEKAAFAKRIFGERAMTGVTALAEDPEQIPQIIAQLSGSLGHNARMAEELNKGLAGSTERMKQGIENLVNVIVENLSPEIKGLTDAIATASNYWADMFRGDRSWSPEMEAERFRRFGKKTDPETYAFEQEQVRVSWGMDKSAGEASLRQRGSPGSAPAWDPSGKLIDSRARWAQTLQTLNWKPKFDDGVSQVAEWKNYQDQLRQIDAFLDEDEYFDSHGIQGVMRAAGKNWKDVVPKPAKPPKKAKPIEYNRNGPAWMEEALAEGFKYRADQEASMREGQTALEGMKAETWIPESEIELLSERMDAVNGIFQAAANQNELVLFQYGERSRTHLLRLVQYHNEASKKQVGVEKAKRDLMYGIAMEGASALVTLFVNGETERFKWAKKIATAEAVVNTFRAAQQIWADPSLLYAEKVLAVGATVLAGAANVAKINATNIGSGASGLTADSPDFGGGGGLDFAPSFAGGPAADDIVSNSGSRSLMVNINVDGFVGSEATLASKVAEMIKEAAGDDLDFGLSINRS